MQPGVNPVGEVLSLPHFISEPMESDSLFVFFLVFSLEVPTSNGKRYVRIIILKKKFYQMLKKCLSNSSLTLDMLLYLNEILLKILMISM